MRPSSEPLVQEILAAIGDGCCASSDIFARMRPQWERLAMWCPEDVETEGMTTEEIAEFGFSMLLVVMLDYGLVRHTDGSYFVPTPDASNRPD